MATKKGYNLLVKFTAWKPIQYFVLWLYRRLLWMQRTIYIWLFKRSLWCVRFNCFMIQEILEEEFKQKYKKRDKEYINNLAFVVSVRTIFNKAYDTLPSLYQGFFESEKKFISTQVKKVIKRNAHIRKIHLQNLLLMAYGSSLFKEKSEGYFNEAKTIDKNARPLTSKEFGKIDKELRKLAKTERKKKEIKEAPKIDIRYDHIKIFMLLASVLFLCTGVLYNHLYLGYFDIELSKFFALEDYIATSIDKIYLTLTSMAAGIAILLYVRPLQWREQTERASKEGAAFSRKIAKIDLTIDDIIPYLLVVGAILGLITGFYFDDIETKYFSFTLLAILVFTHFSVRIVLKYFKQPLPVYICALIIFLFLVLIWSSSMKDRYAIVNDELDKIKKYTIVFENELHLAEENLVLLTSTSKYYFFYDKKTKKTHIIPFHRIISIESKVRQ